MATLHILGSAGYHPNEHRHTTCLALPELGLVLDAGTGFFRLRGLLPRWPSPTVDVLLSHAHIDHVVGLTFFIDVAWPEARGRGPLPAGGVTAALTHRFQVHGAPAHLDAVATRLFDGPLFPLPCPFRRHPVMPEFRLGDATIRTIALPHPGGSTGYRIAHPGLRGDLVFITDTRAPKVPLEFVRGAGTLVHEANFTDDLQPIAEASGHSTAGEVRALARAAGVARTILIHHNPLVEQIAGRATFDPLAMGEVEGIVQAMDGMVLEV